jgi:hypothetical protein
MNLRKKKKYDQSSLNTRGLKIILIILGLFLTVFLGRSFYLGLKQQTLPSDKRVTIGLGTESVLLISYLPEDKSISFIFVPGEIFLPAVGGYGQYKLDLFEHLADLEKEPFVLQESLAYHLAVPIDGWYKADVDLFAHSNVKTVKRWFIRQTWSSFLRFNRLSEKNITNMTRVDFLKLWFWALNSPLKKARLFSLEDYQQKILLPDNSEAFQLDLTKSDFLIQKIVFNPSIKDEELSVGLANATDNAGLAQEVARLVTNIGGTVLKIDNWEKEKDVTEIRIASSDLKETTTVQELKRILNCQAEVGDSKDFLVDVLIILGQDYSKT